MNHKQKFGYIMLGAIIMLIGIGVGAIVSPPLIAQRNGVFDEITCRALSVIDENGKAAINLDTTRFDNTVTVFNKAGLPSVLLTHSSLLGNQVAVYNQADSKAIGLGSGKEGNGIAVFDNAGNTAIRLQTDEEGNDLQILNKGGIAIGLGTHAKGNGITVFDNVGNRALILDGNEEVNMVTVFDKAGNKTIGFYGSSRGVIQTELKP